MPSPGSERGAVDVFYYCLDDLISTMRLHPGLILVVGVRPARPETAGEDD